MYVPINLELRVFSVNLTNRVGITFSRIVAFLLFSQNGLVCPLVMKYLATIDWNVAKLSMHVCYAYARSSQGLNLASLLPLLPAFTWDPSAKYSLSVRWSEQKSAIESVKLIWVLFKSWILPSCSPLSSTRSPDTSLLLHHWMDGNQNWNVLPIHPCTVSSIKIRI